MLQVRANALLSKYSDDFFIDHPLYDDKDFAKKADDFVAPALLNFKMLPDLQEQTFHFQLMNFFKKKANDLRKLILKRPTESRLDAFEQYNLKAAQVRNVICDRNMRLIFKFLNKKVGPNVQSHLGEVTLIAFESINRFDWSLGHKFSPYLLWAISKRFRPWEDHLYKSIRHRPAGKAMYQDYEYDLERISDHRQEDNSREVRRKQEIVHQVLTELSKDKYVADNIRVMKSKLGFFGQKMSNEELCKGTKINPRTISNKKIRAIKAVREYAEKNPHVLAGALD